MASKRTEKKRTGNPQTPKVADSNLFDKFEGRLRGLLGRYSSIIYVVLLIISAAWVVIDKTLLRVPEGHNIPKISIYNTPAEKLDASIRTYYQFPAYKELNINYGGSLVFQNSHKISPMKIGQDSYLMLQMDGEQEARAFNLSKMPIIPFTIQIENQGIKSLLTVEQLKDAGVQIRTFRAIK
jgi:hypothetical protein